ncbi:4718_t:CDS:1 [Paraglomus brasilianum]|uniref:Conserved oligomeric Golgi complex subunit 8 n=1 Tax=Paraglomus brasilianum TaxID=144538 RepID=A0A9N9CPP1_9GLOM|nr:4718_t:CDS:1 [Paraglomus brasilianum]
MEESMILGEVGALETSVEESVDLADHITSLADANAEANVPKSPSASDTSGQEILLSLLCETLPSPDCERTKQSWAKEYLNRLTALPLDSLKLEPSLVKDEEAKIQADLAELCFREYKSFIHTSDCSAQTKDLLDKLDIHLDLLLSTIPSFEKACLSFSQQTEEISRERNSINTILENYNNLVDILEIPQLVDACVQDGAYSEAMDLSAYVTRLLSKYPTIPVIQQIDQCVKRSIQQMLSKLVALLSEPINLPVCLKAIGYLRRMEVFDEAELRLVFLLSRDAYFQSLLRGIEKEKNDPVEYLRQYVGIFKERFFEIVAHYRNVFSDDGSFISSSLYSAPYSPSSPSSPSWKAAMESPTSEISATKPVTASTTVLADYTVHILGQLTTVLAEFTPLINDTSALPTILTQLMYCGMSLGRVGVDFRHLVTGYFETAVHRIIRSMITNATTEFIAEVNQAADKMQLPGVWMVGDKRSSSLNIVDSMSSLRNPSVIDSSSFTPQIILLDYPPLAHLTNAYLNAFNSLRILAPVSLFHPLGSHLSQNLLFIAQILRDYGNTLVEYGHNIVILQGFCATFAQCFVPFITRCFVDGVYGGLLGDGHEHGMGIMDGTASKEGFVIIDHSKILDTLKSILPTPRKVAVHSNGMESNKSNGTVEKANGRNEKIDDNTVDDISLKSNTVANDKIDDGQVTSKMHDDKSVSSEDRRGEEVNDEKANADVIMVS